MKMKVWELEQSDNQISFGMTIDRLLALQKTVTRRYWSTSYANRLLRQSATKPIYATTNWQDGDIVGILNIISITKDDPQNITQDEVNKEGYPELTPSEFLEEFFGDRLNQNKLGYNWWRVEFKIELYDGKYKPLKIYSPSKPYKHISHKKQTWRAYLVAFDVIQSGELDVIHPKNVDEWLIIKAVENNCFASELRAFLNPYLHSI
jgi:hypothetical protein